MRKATSYRDHRYIVHTVHWLSPNKTQQQPYSSRLIVGGNMGVTAPSGNDRAEWIYCRMYIELRALGSPVWRKL